MEQEIQDVECLLDDQVADINPHTMHIAQRDMYYESKCSNVTWVRLIWVCYLFHCSSVHMDRFEG